MLSPRLVGLRWVLAAAANVWLTPCTTQVQLVQSSSQQAQGQGHAALGVLFAPPRGAQRAAADSAAAGAAAAAGPASALPPLLPPLRLGLPLRLTHGPLAPGGYELRVTTTKGPAAQVRRGTRATAILTAVNDTGEVETGKLHPSVDGPSPAA